MELCINLIESYIEKTIILYVLYRNLSIKLHIYQLKVIFNVVYIIVFHFLLIKYSCVKGYDGRIYYSELK